MLRSFPRNFYLRHKPKSTQLIFKSNVIKPILVTISLFIGIKLSHGTDVKLVDFTIRRGDFHEPNSHNFRMLSVECIVPYEFRLFLLFCLSK